MLGPNAISTMLSWSQIRARGWTPALIGQFLGSPDVTRPNPYYPKGAAMKLYAWNRIHAAESDPTWRRAAAQARQRRDTTRHHAEQREQRAVLQAQDMSIVLPALSASELVRRALHNADHLARHTRFAPDVHAPQALTSHASPVKLFSLQVHYARIFLVEYDRGVEVFFARAGMLRATTTLRRRIYAKIAAVFPWLEHECARQLMRHWHRELNVLPKQTGIATPPERAGHAPNLF